MNVPWRARATPVVAVAIVLILGVVFVALTLRQPDVATYAPTIAAPRDAGRALVGPQLYTVDATSPERWTYFSFRVGAVVEGPGGRTWDLAFRRYQILANGGPGFQGEGGVVDLGALRFDDVRSVPTTGYVPNEGGVDPRNPAIAGWYRYGFFSHVLTPKPHAWAIRTADGRYAKVEIVSYYCPRAQPGCVTFRYAYQGDGSPVVSRAAAARSPRSASCGRDGAASSRCSPGWT